MTEKVLQVKNLTKKYGELTAVDNVSFEIEKGELVGLLGHNGAGKTTMFVMLTGLTMPTNGSIKICEKEIGRNVMNLKENVSFLPDNSLLYGNLTAKQNLEYFCELADEDKSKIPGLLESVGMTEWANKKVGQFSKGMTQRLGIAQTLIKKPKLIILDEPMSGLDPEARVEMNKLLKSLNEKGISIILSSHVISEISNICTKVAIMRKGKLVAFDSLDNLVEKKTSGKKVIVLETTDRLKTYSVLRKMKGISFSEEKGRFTLLSTKDIKREVGFELLKAGVSIVTLTNKKRDLFNVLEEFYK